MHRNAKIVLGLTIVLLGVFAILLAAGWGKKAPDSEASLAEGVKQGEVTGYDYQPNQAEDGHYSFTVTLEDQTELTVDATGFMNSPYTPEQDKYTCLEVPEPELISERNVTFKLPEQENNYSTCFLKSENEAYFINFGSGFEPTNDTEY